MTLSNTFFDYHRFCLLAKKDWRENRTKIILKILGYLGCMALIMCWMAYVSYRNYTFSSNIPSEDPFLSGNGLLTIFALFGLIFGALLGGTMASNMGNKAARINALMTPATQFEKYMIRWIYITLLSCFLYIGLFILSDLIRVGVFSALFPKIPISHIELGSFFRGDDSNMGFDWSILFAFICCYWAVQSFFMLTNAIWPQKGLKGLVAIILLGVLYIYAFVNFSEIFISNLQFSSFKSQFNPLIPFSIINLIIAVVNWILTYYRLKESEIIQRM